MFNSPFDASANFDLQQSRNSREHRRASVHYTVMQVLREGFDTLEKWVEWFNSRFETASCNEKDNVNFRQYRHQIREISRGWRDLDEETQEDFIAGRIVPSTLSNRLRQWRLGRRRG